MNKFTTTSLLQTSLLQRHKIMPYSTGNILMLARALYSKRIIVIILFGTKVPISYSSGVNKVPNAVVPDYGKI